MTGIIKAPVAGGGGSSTASSIINTPAGNILATDVQAALNELDAEKQGVLVSATNIKTINGISILGTGNIDVAGGASSAAATVFTPTGSIAATDVQSAIAELDADMGNITTALAAILGA